eukprot:6207651-Pleurochrysis_carterae.AAC.5
MAPPMSLQSESPPCQGRTAHAPPLEPTTHRACTSEKARLLLPAAPERACHGHTRPDVDPVRPQAQAPPLQPRFDECSPRGEDRVEHPTRRLAGADVQTEGAVLGTTRA